MAQLIQMLALSPTMEEGVILKWNKSEGDDIREGDIICEVETDKSSMEYESPFAGVLLKIQVSEGTAAKVGDVIGVIGDKGEDYASLLDSSASNTANSATDATLESPESVVAPNIDQTPVQQKDGLDRIYASPLAKRIAEEHTIDLATLTGTGPQGRIIKKDVEQALEKNIAKGQHSTTHATLAPNLTSVPTNQATENEIIPVSGIRAVIAKRLHSSKHDSPHFYLKKTVNIDPLFAFRSLCNNELTMHDKDAKKLSLNAFFILLCAKALSHHREVNAGWQDTENGACIVRFGSIDIGLAVDVGAGLTTPIVKNAAHKNVRQIDQDLKLLIQKASEKTLQPHEYAEPSFTITNLGSFDVDEFYPIVNPPGAAILGIGSKKKQVVVDEQDNFVIKHMVTLTLSADHRVIDGLVVAAFFRTLAAFVENPSLALL